MEVVMAVQVVAVQALPLVEQEQDQPIRVLSPEIQELTDLDLMVL